MLPPQRAIFSHPYFRKWFEAVVFCAVWLQNALGATAACQFPHPNFQEWWKHGVICTFWLQNALCATAACNFSFLIWPGGSSPAALASPLFDAPGSQIIGKTQWFRDFPNIFRTCIFFVLTLSLSFYSSLLCFSSLHIVGSLTLGYIDLFNLFVITHAEYNYMYTWIHICTKF